MANFIGQTRLVRTATGVSGASVPIDPPVTVATLPGVARLADFIPLLNPVPSLAERGGFRLEYDLRCFYVVRVRGAIPPFGHIYVQYAVWRVKPPVLDLDQFPPDWHNSHIFGGLRVGPGLGQRIQDAIEDEIRTAHFQNRGGEDRDNRWTPVDDPANTVLQDAGVRALHLKTVEYL